MLQVRRFVVFVFGILACVLLGGCATYSGLHLHDPEMAKLAGTVVTDVEAAGAELRKAIEENGQRNDQLLRAEIESYVRRANLNRDLELALVVGSEKPLKEVWYENYFRKRLADGFKLDPDKTCVRDKQQWSALQCFRLDAWDARERAEHVMEVQRNLRDNGYSGDTTCSTALTKGLDEEALAKVPGDPKVIRVVFGGLRKDCEELETANQGINAIGGDVADALTALREAEEHAARALANAKGAEAAVKTANEKLKKATEEAGGVPPSKAINEARNTLQKAVEGAGAAAEAFGVTVVEAKLEIVNNVLKAAASGKEEDINGLKGRSAQAAALIIAALPQLAEDVAAIERLLESPHLTPLTIVSRQLEAERSEAMALKLAWDVRVARQKKQYEALIAELEEYEEVAALVTRAEDHYFGCVMDKRTKKKRCAIPAGYSATRCAVLCQPAAEFLTRNPGANYRLGRAQMAIKSAIARQAAAQGSTYARSKRLKLEDIAFDYLTINIESRSGVDQWLALIGPLVAQHKAYHEGGIKSDELAALIIQIAQAVGLFQIAAEQ